MNTEKGVVMMISRPDTLNPCPFCGSKNVTKSLGVGLKWTVGCNDCGCRTRECTHSIDAVDAWNRRAEASVGCHECGCRSGECLHSVDEDVDEAQHISQIMKDMMARGYPDDDCDENHMLMPLSGQETPF